ncbi:class I SAM-dependent methyltransferase [Streptomyces sp. NPDC023838]|uniref:class I SAM-dependent methyltransferase n=1 Tax=Streptomyces sp. NPDC023838 TaxID=3154325 RepID=UPI0033FBCB9C
MSVTSRYKDAWDGFWNAAPDEQGAVFWDAEPALTAGPHLALFEPHLADLALPMVDLGCGNGTQSRFFADRYDSVVGVDLSSAAVERARSQDPDGRVRFDQLDATDEKAVHELHARLGDANVYVRGVLHQCEPADRQPLADAVATLVGTRGRALLVELAEAAKPVLMGLAQDPAGAPPKLRPVFAHGLTPVDVADAAVPALLGAAGLTVVARGELPLTTTEYRPDGTRIALPSTWWVVGRTG